MPPRTTLITVTTQFELVTDDGRTIIATPLRLSLKNDVTMMKMQVEKISCLGLGNDLSSSLCVFVCCGATVRCQYRAWVRHDNTH
jgi:hypothetical protein